MNKTPKVELVNSTPNPIEYLYAAEKYAKTDIDIPIMHDHKVIARIRRDVGNNKDEIKLVDRILTNNHLEDLRTYYPQFSELSYEDSWRAYVKEVEDWALKVASMGIPIAEQVVFNWKISNVTIAWREQLVRNRTNSCWIQSGRITNNSTFADREAYNNPFRNSKDRLADPIRVDFDHPQDECSNNYLSFDFKSAAALFDWVMSVEQNAYAALKGAGARDEDSRELLGSGIHHRLTLRTDLRSLMGMLKSRNCWISQGHWGTIVMQMIQELVTKVDPTFQVLGNPPCMAADKSIGKCAYDAMATERHEGKDPLPVCPMWRSIQVSGKGTTAKSDVLSVDELTKLGRWDKERNKEYAKLWRKDDLEL